MRLSHLMVAAALVADVCSSQAWAAPKSAGAGAKGKGAIVAMCRKKYGTTELNTQARRQAAAMIRQCIASGGKT